MAVPLPVIDDHTFYAGTDALLSYRWLIGGTDPQDLTGWTATMRFGPRRSGEPVLDLDGAPALTLGADGSIAIHVTAEQTASLTASRYFYVLDLIDPDGTIRRFLRGRIAVVHELEEVAP